MRGQKLSTESYKGVRDFYPEDASVQQYIFDTWRKTAESFGFVRYDASILEPSELYKAKGAENEEMVNEQTYTFTDRGDREVTLRPEMTPTVARMVAGKRRELSFPLRWYSIPNLFRYERMQRGRLREHWQLNCDIFGGDQNTADVEIIALAHQLFIDFGAKPEQFVIRINNRRVYVEFLQSVGVNAGIELSNQQCLDILRLRDRQDKMPPETYLSSLEQIVGVEAYPVFAEQLHLKDNSEFDSEGLDELSVVCRQLVELGIHNAKLDHKISRGFDYYTGIVFEVFELNSEGNQVGRAMLGGGRYDNLTEMFGGEPVSGVGFGTGDVRLREFIEDYDLIPKSAKKSTLDLVVIPNDPSLFIEAEKIAQSGRRHGLNVSVDIGSKKLGKKISDAGDRGVGHVLVFGEDEINSQNFTVKNLNEGKETSGTLEELFEQI